MKHTRPSDIETTSMQIITRELSEAGIHITGENEAVVKRVIHATADFDFAGNLVFTEHAAECGVKALLSHTPIITDTNMALSGLSRPSLAKLGCEAYCFMADSDVAERAKAAGTTRAVSAMEYAAVKYPGAILAIGNAPTALYKIAEQIEKGLRPALVIGVPVGFVNVVEGKEKIWNTCRRHDIPAIVAEGRKGGSTVAVAILNALLYTAAGTLEPEKRGWN